MTLATARLLVGRAIVAVDLRSYPDGRGGKAYNPVFTLDNGATVTFEIVETDAHNELDGIASHQEGVPGVRPVYQSGTPAQKRRAARLRDVARQAIGAMLAGGEGEGDAIGTTHDELREARRVYL